MAPTSPPSTRPALTALERAAREAWAHWGEGYALFTRCDGCGEVVHCRGPKRERMLCLTCFDLGVKAKKGGS